MAQVYGLDQNYVDSVVIAQKVIQGLYSGVTTSELDELAAQTGRPPLNQGDQTREIDTHCTNGVCFHGSCLLRYTASGFFTPGGTVVYLKFAQEHHQVVL